MRLNNLKLKTAISINLKAIRKDLGMNQVDFANHIGVSQASLSRYESGLHKPNDPELEQICEALKINETDLTSDPNILLAYKAFNELNKKSKKRLK